MYSLKSRWTHLLAAAVMGVGLSTAQAEDIDIFVTGQAANSSVPSVLIILDNTANWNSAFTNEISALSSTINAIGVGKVKLGLMMFTETGSGNSNTDGGYVRAAIRTLNSDYKTKLTSLVNSLNVGNDKANAGKAALAMIEAYRYLSGGAPRAGNNKVKTDYAGNTNGTTADTAVWALTGNALSGKGATSYAAPPLGTCGKTFIIYLSNGAAQDSANDIKTAEAALVAAGGSTTVIPISPSGSRDNPADEIARFMSGSALNASVYTIDVDKVTTGQGPGWTALLKSMANVSNGRYYDASSGNAGADIAAAFTDIFTEIQAVNSAFASVSLPVSVNTQGTYLNQVFVGHFRPDADAKPRWQGNLKQFKLGYVNGTLSLVDAAGVNATSDTTGFIASCARSFWTPSIVDSYWASLSPGNQCPEPAGVDYKSSNYPDGPIVEKGGQAYVLRSASGTRNVKTCSPTFASCTSLVDFNTSLSTGTYTPAIFGQADNDARNSLIDWARGTDVDDENVNDNRTERRPSIHGDVVHSRPVAINFGTDTVPQVVVFYGANDGMLRAINGNRTAAITSPAGVSTAAGGEFWSFMPPEFFGRLGRLRQNTVQVSFPTITGGQPKPYGFDGPITSTKNAAGNTLIFATMRRGGRAMYAFDVSIPGAPALKWKIGCPTQGSDVDCAAGFSDIGQTWSAAVPLKASGYGSGLTPLLVVGGGYDTCEDTDSSDACGATSKGRRIYFFDADTGVLQKTFTTDRAVVADVTVVPDPTTGMASYAYAVDLGGNVYRIAIGAAQPSAWSMTKLASLGCDTPTTCSPRRKFFYPPDVVEDRGTYYLLLGSGDREKPLTSATEASYPRAAAVANHFFSIKDQPATSTWLSTESSTCGGVSVVCLGSLQSISGNTTPSAAELSAKKGWYLSLAAKEQVVTSAITIYGTASFSTTQPLVGSSTSCVPSLGTARVYSLGYLDAASKNGTANRYETLPAGGLPPSPVAGKVTLDDGTTVPFVIGGSGSSSLSSQAKPPVATGRAQPGKRVYTIIKK